MIRQPLLYTVGIDLGGTSAKIGVCRGANIIHRSKPLPTGRDLPREDLIDKLAAEIKNLQGQYPEIQAIGLGVPGLVDYDDGFIYNLTNLQGWKEVPFRKIFEEKTGLPVAVENDANAMAYAEFRYGAARGMKNVVAMTLGTGVGGGLILNGQMYRGHQFVAGEIGQLSIDYKGRMGVYGNLGAVEQYVGNNQIAQHAVLQYARAGLSHEAEECTPRHIAEWAAAGDTVAIAIWQDIAEWLGTTLANIVWLLNPDAIVIGGGVAQAGSVLMAPLEARLRQMLSSILFDQLKILPAKFGNDAGIIGNAALAVDYLKERELLNKKRVDIHGKIKAQLVKEPQIAMA